MLGPVPGVIGTLQALECIKIVSGFGEPLSQVLHLHYPRTLFIVAGDGGVFARCVSQRQALRKQLGVCPFASISVVKIYRYW